MCTERTCAICGTIFIGRTNAKYCCNECKSKGKQLVYKKWREEHADYLKEANREYWYKNHERNIAQSRKYYREHQEELLKKKHEYVKKNRDAINQHKREVYQERKEELKQRVKDYYRKNADKKKEYHRNYYRNNLAKIKEWEKANRDKNNEVSRKRRKERLANDIDYALNVYVHSLVPRCLKLKGTKKYYKKDRRTYEILGYTSDDLKKHIESLFQEGMTWENRGEWEIHHIKPIATFTFINEDSTINYDAIREANALENLVPIWKKEHSKITAKFNRSWVYHLDEVDN